MGGMEGWSFMRGFFFITSFRSLRSFAANLQSQTPSVLPPQFAEEALEFCFGLGESGGEFRGGDPVAAAGGDGGLDEAVIGGDGEVVIGRVAGG